VECLTCGHERRDSRTRSEEIGEFGSGRQDVFEVVQHEQHVPRTKPLVNAVPYGPFTQVPEPERASDGGHHLLGIGQRGEVDENNPVAEFRNRLTCEFNCQSSLAGPTGTGERDQSSAVRQERFAGNRDVAPAADKPSRGYGHAAGVAGLATLRKRCR
jgi:hypothetical protein